MKTVSMRVPPAANEKEFLIPATPVRDTTLEQANSEQTDGEKFDVAYPKLRVLMICTACTHLASAISISAQYAVRSGNGLTTGGGYVERIASCWDMATIPDNTTDTGNKTSLIITNMVSTSTGYTRNDAIAGLVAVFFGMSAFFQWLSWYCKDFHMLATRKNAPQWPRYTEYSITASCMMVTIFLAIGLLDAYLHVSAFLFTSVCMFAGLLADNIRDISSSCAENVAMKLRNVMVSSACIGWLCMFTPWAIVFTAFHDLRHETLADVCGTTFTHLQPPSFNTPAEGGSMPWWVPFIIVGQFMLFNSFGVVQIYQFYRQFHFNPFIQNQWLTLKRSYSPELTGLVVETWFVALSLFSKTLLGWLLFTQVLFQ